MKNPKILFVAPLKDFSGYAHASRDFVRALDKQGCNLVTRHLRYDRGNYEYNEREKELESKDTQDVDIVFQQTTPNESQRKDGIFNIIHFAWETDRVPQEWTHKLNQMDLVLVPCEENVRACRRSNVIVPVEKVPYAFDIDKYAVEHKPFAIPNGEEVFKMLSVCQFTKKKGLDILLKSYLSEFTPEDNTLLILKVYINGIQQDSEEQKQVVNQLIDKVKSVLRLPSYPKVCIIHDVMSDNDVARLYSTANAYVLPSRGEGFSLTHFDAMGYGCPPIAVNWGGPTEFITNHEGWLVDFNLSPVTDMQHPFPYLYTANENWAEPHLLHLRQCMRTASHEWKFHNMLGRKKSPWTRRINACKNRVNDFSHDRIGKQLKETILKYYKEWKEHVYKSNVAV